MEISAPNIQMSTVCYLSMPIAGEWEGLKVREAWILAHILKCPLYITCICIIDARGLRNGTRLWLRRKGTDLPSIAAACQHMDGECMHIGRGHVDVARLRVHFVDITWESMYVAWHGVDVARARVHFVWYDVDITRGRMYVAWYGVDITRLRMCVIWHYVDITWESMYVARSHIDITRPSMCVAWDGVDITRLRLYGTGHCVVIARRREHFV